MKFSGLLALFIAGLIERSEQAGLRKLPAVPAPDCLSVGNGYQICMNDSWYYECVTGWGAMTRPLAAGTKCCSNLATERITMVFPGSECPTEMPSASPSAAPSTSPSKSPTPLPTPVPTAAASIPV